MAIRRFTQRGGKLVLSRLVCPYPAEAVYSGRGDVNDATNFSCGTLKDRGVTAGDLVHIRNSLSQRGLLLPNR